MAGIYLHIPFCKQACHYCDFHFSTSMNTKEEVLSAMLKELVERKSELEGHPIESIYFGGGTPSLLTAGEIGQMLETIDQNYNITSNVEITLEANPDDLNMSKLRELKQTPINRLSIGIQSFHQDDLTYLNRVHSSEQGHRCIKESQDIGFENLTIDFIYGIPTLSNMGWEENLTWVIKNQIPHVSAYALTVEENTPLFFLIRKGASKRVDEDKVADQFFMLTQLLENAGYEQYEISNFAKTGCRSRHNSGYWNGLPYLGVGPGAHSFNGKSKRRWNIANNVKYFRQLNSGDIYYESEELSAVDRLNEYIMTHIRIKEGLDLQYIRNEFGSSVVQELLTVADAHWDGMYTTQNECLVLTKQGLIVSDNLAARAFFSNLK